MPTGIRFPLDKPASAQGFSDTYEETRSTVEMTTGPDRVRNRMTLAPRVFTLQWKLVQAEYELFAAWWQDTIKGGALEFDVLILDDTETPAWYTSRWIKVYKAEISSDAGTDWIVSGQIRAEGDSFAVRDAGTDELQGRAAFSLRASGELFIATPFYGRASFRFLAHGALEQPAMEGRAAFHFLAKGRFATIIEYELREDGSFELREDGGLEQRGT